MACFYTVMKNIKAKITCLNDTELTLGKSFDLESGFIEPLKNHQLWGCYIKRDTTSFGNIPKPCDTVKET